MYLVVLEYVYNVLYVTTYLLTSSRVQRLSYVGELGYEFFLPNEQCVDLYETLMKFNPKLAGLEALNAMSMEKGHHHWHGDIGMYVYLYNF